MFTISQGIALERNRDEWMRRMRRMGSQPMQAAGASKLVAMARFRSHPKGSGVGGPSAALPRLWIAVLSTAHRALHPIPPTPLRDPWEIVNTFL
ncbi:hypothetical protein, partial [Paracidovorax wautersii]|uniref:hypothetical protein n=1 Tax=Paracidovorax wautersii TaxID=1177982 RepID=UPI0031D01434